MSGGGGSKPPDPGGTYASKTSKNLFNPTIKKYAEFVTKQKKERNLLQVRFSRSSKDSPVNRQLDLDTMSEYLFLHLEVKPEDLLEVDFNTGRWDTKHLLFKPGVNTDKYVSEFPDTFNDYLVTVSKISITETKVTFRNVPTYVPDMELLNLCALYGSIESEMSRERVSLTTVKGRIAVPTSSRFVYMKLQPGKRLNNYYWFDGPLPGDQGRRVTVLHNGQHQQCSHCLRTADTGCQGLGNGRMCEENGGVRAKMSEYMRSFKEETGYKSLKEEYVETMQRLHKGFDQDVGSTPPDDMDEYVANCDSMDGETETDDPNKQKPVYINPLHKRDKIIADLNDKLKEAVEQKESMITDYTNKLKDNNKQIPELKEAKDKAEEKTSRIKNILERKIKEFVTKGKKQDIDSLASLYASTVNDKDIDKEDPNVWKLKETEVVVLLAKSDMNVDQKSRSKRIIERIQECLKDQVATRKRSMSCKRERDQKEEVEQNDIKLPRHGDTPPSQRS